MDFVTGEADRSKAIFLTLIPVAVASIDGGGATLGSSYLSKADEWRPVARTPCRTSLWFLNYAENALCFARRRRR